MRKQFALYFSILIFTSCTGDYGSKVIGENLTVYFQDNRDEAKATDLAKYLKKRKLLSGEKQDVQLVRIEDKYLVKVIANDIENAKKMPFDERSLLLNLQKELQDSVFSKTIVKLVICNNEFETIYDLNQ